MCYFEVSKLHFNKSSLYINIYTYIYDILMIASMTINNKLKESRD